MKKRSGQPGRNAEKRAKARANRKTALSKAERKRAEAQAKPRPRPGGFQVPADLGDYPEEVSAFLSTNCRACGGPRRPPTPEEVMEIDGEPIPAGWDALYCEACEEVSLVSPPMQWS